MFSNLLKIINATHKLSLLLKFAVQVKRQQVHLHEGKYNHKAQHSSPIAIISLQIRAPSPQTTKNISSSKLGNLVSNVSRRRESAQHALEVEHQARDVRRGHRRARDDVGGRVGADPGGQGVDAGGKDVDDAAVVAPRGLGVVDGDCAHGDGLGGAAGGVVLCVGAVVACCYDCGDAC
jgi:hypothetical protein